MSSDYDWEISVSNAAYPSENITTYDARGYNDYISYYYALFGTSDYDPDSFSLLRNNTAAKFYFKLGKRYVARIRAVNDIGASAWTYAVFDGGSCASINRYRIIYSTNAGATVRYASQSADGVPVDTPADSDWLGWYVGEISYDSDGNLTDGNKYPMTDGISCDGYTGHTSLYLVGAYTDDDSASEFAWADYDVALLGVKDGATTVEFAELSSGATSAPTIRQWR